LFTDYFVQTNQFVYSNSNRDNFVSPFLKRKELEEIENSLEYKELINEKKLEDTYKTKS